MNDSFVLAKKPKPFNKMQCLMKDDWQFIVDEYPNHKYNGRMSVETHFCFIVE